MKNITLIIVFSLFSMNLFAVVQPQILKKGQATYTITWDHDFAQLKDLTPEIKINGHWVSANEFKKIEWKSSEGNRISEPNNYEGKTEIMELVCKNHPYIEEFILRFETMADRPYIVMNASLKAAQTFSLGGIKLFNSPKENILLPGNSKDWVIFNENAAAPHVGAIMYPYQLNTKRAEIGSFLQAHTGVWVSMLINDKENYAFSFASLTGELWPGNFKWELPVNNDFNKLRVSARTGSFEEKEEIIVPVGKQIISDAFLVGFWDNQRPTKTLLETGKVMGQNVRKGKPMHCPEPGWSSWHSYKREISDSCIEVATDFMAKNLMGFGWKTVQIDGGWWTNAGLYYVNDNFAKGIRNTSNYVSEKNLDFGLHISPLRVNPADLVFVRHPDWILKPFDEKEVMADDDEMVTTIGAQYVDASNPEVPAFLSGRFQQLVEDYRPSFMKWDHHYGALKEGIRKDSTMTFLQAHNKAIREIRAALPEDLIVTRSMGYLLGALECYDAIRIGNDINHPGIKSPEEPYATITYGKTLGTIEDEQVGKGLIRFARQAAQNYYVHKNIAICDPDAFFVNPLYTLDEAKCHMTLEAIMGGLFFCGDRLETLPEDRLELLKNKEIIAINKIGEHAIPLDLFSGVDIPTIWKLETKDRLIITIFNWLDNDVTKTYNLKTDFELNNSKYKLTELWTKKNINLGSDKLTLAQPAHSVKIIEFVKL